MLTSLRSVAAAGLAVAFAAASVRAAPQATSPQPGSNPPAQACNNSPQLCGRKYNDVTYMGAHDSAFLRDSSTGNSIAGNQFQNATVALDAGLRMLQAQVLKPGSTLQLCHTSCNLLDAGPLSTWLSAINDWLRANPNEVVTILLVNVNNAPASDFDAAFQASGLSRLGYETQTTAPTTNWPTLGSMISQGTRVVSFVTNIDYSPSMPYLLPEFNFVFETPFEVTELTGFNCTADRPERARPAPTAVSSGWLSLVNHFKYQNLISDIMVPDVDRIAITNSPATATTGNLGLHAEQCRSEWNKQPNFVLVDFWDRQNPIQAADTLNGLSSTTGRKSLGAVSSGAGAARGGGLGCGALLAFVTAALLGVV